MSQNKSVLIPDSLAQQFLDDGVVVIRNAFSADWIDLLSRGLDKNIANPGRYRREYTPEGGTGHFFGDYCNWSRIPEYEDFARNSPAAEIAGTLMKSQKVNLCH